MTASPLPSRPLGATGLTVSVLSLGTVALGMPYGLPGNIGVPGFAAAVDLVRRAREEGITFFDTAPAYGAAEAVLGEALAGDAGAVIATKVVPPRDRLETAADEIRRSVERSLATLRRSRLDLLKIHSATAADLADERLLRVLDELRGEGVITAAGATVYGPADALAAIATGRLGVVQIAFNILDQRAIPDVFAAAEAAGVGIVARSALLKGLLTPRWRSLPENAAALRRAAAGVVEALGGDDRELAAAALRFCLSHAPPIASVLIGAADGAELAQAFAAARQGPLPAGLLARLGRAAIGDEAVLNPSLWPAGA